jgi:hypothetical protein
MKFFLRMAFGDSREFAGLTIEVKTQGLDKGGSAPLAGWCVISIMILQAHGAKGHGAHFIAPLSQVHSSLSAILYVDDTDLLHLDMDGIERVVEVHAALQCAIDNWGKLLIATGGTLKPNKYFSSHRLPVDTTHCSCVCSSARWVVGAYSTAYGGRCSKDPRNYYMSIWE